jgi:putative membrane protein
MALPCYFALYKWLGLKKSLFLIITLSVYAFAIETIAIITGFPYSSFQYTELIGYKIFGYTPYTVPFAYVPLFIGCFYLASLKSINMWKIIILSTLLVLVADLILDPAAVALNFWIYQSPGFFYGVPLMNFMGWILTGFLSSLITAYILKDHIVDSNKPKAIISSLFLILVFWSAVCFYLNLLIPGIIGLVFIVYILYETKGKIGKFYSA